MLPDMNEKKGKLSLQISSKGTSYAGSQVLPFWQGVSVGKDLKKKLGTAFYLNFVYVWPLDCEVPISGLPNLRHVDMLRIRKVQALRIYQAQVFMSIFC